MAAITVKSTKLGLFGVAAVAIGVAALAFGAGIAGADPNDPSMDRVGGDGTVSSRQAASTSSSDYCAVNPGTLGTSSIIASDVGTPTQHAAEAGPEWVGSRGWQAVGLSPSNPWGGNFNPQNTKTGPQCKQGSASGF